MILETILAQTRNALDARKGNCPLAALRERLLDARRPLDLCQVLGEPGVSVIAEIKRASPSRGRLNMELQPVQLALEYAGAGAAALSVLTEETHFKGCLDDLAAARQALDQAGRQLPILRKDFIVDAYQLVEARLWGADAALLIVASLDDAELAELYEEALKLGLTPLMEVHDDDDLRRVLPLQPALVGINNRDLRTFQVDIDTTRRLRPRVPVNTRVVSESGIHSPTTLRQLAQVGIDAVLIGEALVTSDQPGATLRSLVEAGR